MPSLQKASSVLNLLGAEVKHIAHLDHWPANDLGGCLRVVVVSVT